VASRSGVIDAAIDMIAETRVEKQRRSSETAKKAATPAARDPPLRQQVSNVWAIVRKSSGAGTRNALQRASTIRSDLRRCGPGCVSDGCGARTEYISAYYALLAKGGRAVTQCARRSASCTNVTALRWTAKSAPASGRKRSARCDPDAGRPCSRAPRGRHHAMVLDTKKRDRCALHAIGALDAR